MFICATKEDSIKMLKRELRGCW